MDSGSGRLRCARHPVRNDAARVAGGMQSLRRVSPRNEIPSLKKESLDGRDDFAGAEESITRRSGAPHAAATSKQELHS
jgi:hypothetical protein